jgi:hypothetical protein
MEDAGSIGSWKWEKGIKSTGENPSEYQWFLSNVSKEYVKTPVDGVWGLKDWLKVFTD